MAFVYEKILEEDWYLWLSLGIKDLSGKKPLEIIKNQSKWYRDHYRNAFLVCIGGGNNEVPLTYDFWWNYEVMRLEVEVTTTERNNLYDVNWTINKIPIPPILWSRRNIVLKMIKEAFMANPYYFIPEQINSINVIINCQPECVGEQKKTNFVHEKMSDEDIELYNSFKIYDYDRKKYSLGGSYSWLVDRERELYFIEVNMGAFDRRPAQYTLVWKGEKIDLFLNPYKSGGCTVYDEDGDRKDEHGKSYYWERHWYIDRVFAHRKLSNKKEEILELVKEAVMAYNNEHFVLSYLPSCPSWHETEYMVFENVCLTEEEKEEFKKRAILEPDRNVHSQLKSFLGDDHFAKCTVDRERKIYLFYCGMGSYKFVIPPKDHYFALVWDDVTGNNCASFCLKYEILPANKHRGRAILWHLISMKIPNGLEDKKSEIIDAFKEAMKVYCKLGNPKIKSTHIVFFDFPKEEKLNGFKYKPLPRNKTSKKVIKASLPKLNKKLLLFDLIIFIIAMIIIFIIYLANFQ